MTSNESIPPIQGTILEKVVAMGEGETSHGQLVVPDIESGHGASDAQKFDLGTNNTALVWTATKASTKGRPNEDRTFVHKFPHGLLVGVLDGHHSAELSDYTAKHFPPMLADAITSRGEDVTVEAAMIQAFEAYDASLYNTLIAAFKHYESDEVKTTWENWSVQDVYNVLGTRDDPVFQAARRTTTGTCVLVGYFSHNDELFIASLGDSEAVTGHMTEEQWSASHLNDLHNCHNLSERERLAKEHPDEPKVIDNNRLLGGLAVTRAFGDFMFKVEPRISQAILQYAYPSTVPSMALKSWASRKHTPPYMLATPSIRRFVTTSKVFVFASDGLRTHSSLKQLNETDRALSIASLAREAVDADAQNAAASVIEGVFGVDNLDIEDDVTVIVVCL